MFGNPMQRHKTSMPVFAVQRQRKYSESDPVSGFIRVHETSSSYGPWTGDGKKGQPEKDVL